MSADVWSLYFDMLRSRLFEEAVGTLWREGLISGEMHLGTGEEAISAGVVTHLGDGDALALDHRGTAALLLHGVEPRSILLELLGHPAGLCGGRGGHMHLFSAAHLAASSGIVGASGPAGTGFALAARYLRPGSVAVSFFGDGAMNQGMLLESFNLASTWILPVVFVCKDDGWAITTESGSVTAGDLCDRARAFGLTAETLDGGDVMEVYRSAGEAIRRARNGGGPSFLQARCVHLEGHFLGFQLLRLARDPVRESMNVAGSLTRSILRPGGAGIGQRLAGVRSLLASVRRSMDDPREEQANDPLVRTRRQLEADSARLEALEMAAETEIAEVVSGVLEEVST